MHTVLCEQMTSQ